MVGLTGLEPPHGPRLRRPARSAAFTAGLPSGRRFQLACGVALNLAPTRPVDDGEDLRAVPLQFWRGPCHGRGGAPEESAGARRRSRASVVSWRLCRPARHRRSAFAAPAAERLEQAIVGGDGPRYRRAGRTRTRPAARATGRVAFGLAGSNAARNRDGLRDDDDRARNRRVRGSRHTAGDALRRSPLAPSPGGSAGRPRRVRQVDGVPFEALGAVVRQQVHAGPRSRRASDAPRLSRSARTASDGERWIRGRQVLQECRAVARGEAGARSRPSEPASAATSSSPMRSTNAARRRRPARRLSRPAAPAATDAATRGSRAGRRTAAANGERDCRRVSAHPRWPAAGR